MEGSSSSETRSQTLSGDLVVVGRRYNHRAYQPAYRDRAADDDDDDGGGGGGMVKEVADPERLRDADFCVIRNDDDSPDSEGLNANKRAARFRDLIRRVIHRNAKSGYRDPERRANGEDRPICTRWTSGAATLKRKQSDWFLKSSHHAE